MTRIALLPSAYLPHLGGVEELTRHLALALKSDGNDVEVWTQQDDARTLPATELRDGMIIRRFPFPLPRAHPRAVTDFPIGACRTMAGLLGAVRAFRPDVLHVQCFGPNGIYATALSHLTGIPLVVSLQGETVMDDDDIYNHSSTLRAGLRHGMRHAARVTACSDFTLRDAEKRFGLPTGHGEVIFNGVQLNADPPGQGLPSAFPTSIKRYVLGLGRLVPKKGFDLLIRGFAAVSIEHPDVDLVIAGSGPAEPSLRELASNLAISHRVHLVGRLSRTEVATAMYYSDLFVLPSPLEPFGIVLLEAWRAGTPTISTCNGGPSEYVRDRETGLLIDPTDTAGLAASLDRLLGSPAFSQQLADRAKLDLIQFDWSVVASSYRRCYSAAMVGAARRRI